MSLSFNRATAEEARSISLTDGRVITYRVYGDPSGPPVLALHGTPGSRTKFAMADTCAAELGLRLIAVDRWGYAGTAPPLRPSLALFADDMAQLADALGLARFGIIGVSGGGPYAAAVAARLGSRITALALVAPVGPIVGAPDRVKLSSFHTFCFRLLPRLPGAIRLTFGVFRMLLAVSASGAMRVAAARASPADRSALCAPAARDRLADCFRLGLARGLSGPVIDMQLFARPWEIELQAITAPARLWLGSEDRNVPRLAARGLARNIKHCELIVLPGKGHYWITQHHGEVLGWVSRAMQAGDTATPKKSAATAIHRQ